MDSSNFKVRQTYYTNSEWTELYLFVSVVCKQYRSFVTEQCLCAYAGVLNQCSEVWSGNMIHSDFRQQVWFGEEGKSSFKLVWALQVTFFFRPPPLQTTKAQQNQNPKTTTPFTSVSTREDTKILYKKWLRTGYDTLEHGYVTWVCKNPKWWRLGFNWGRLGC